jgi:hypothetical protein
MPAASFERSNGGAVAPPPPPPPAKAGSLDEPVIGEFLRMFPNAGPD